MRFHSTIRMTVCIRQAITFPSHLMRSINGCIIVVTLSTFPTQYYIVSDITYLRRYLPGAG